MIHHATSATVIDVILGDISTFICNGEFPFTFTKVVFSCSIKYWDTNPKIATGLEFETLSQFLYYDSVFDVAKISEATINQLSNYYM